MMIQSSFGRESRRHTICPRYTSRASIGWIEDGDHPGGPPFAGRGQGAPASLRCLAIRVAGMLPIFLHQFLPSQRKGANA